MGLGLACRAHACGVRAMCVRCLMIKHHVDAESEARGDGEAFSP